MFVSWRREAARIGSMMVVVLFDGLDKEGTVGNVWNLRTVYEGMFSALSNCLLMFLPAMASLIV